MSNPFIPEHHPIILFDGVCNFCNSSVQFIIKRDKTQRLRYAPLQSAIGDALKKKFNIPENIDSVILVEDGQYSIQSTAALKIAHHFGGLWKAFLVFWFIPKFIRDFFYDIIAKNRYRWFGKKESCMIPTPEQRKLFL